MNNDAISSAIDSLKAVYTVLLVLSLGEAFSELVDKETAGDAHRKIITDRILNLLPFLLLIIPFIQGMDRYFFDVYKTAARPNPYGPHLLSDCIVFTLEGSLFFILARSLNIERWRRFYSTIIVLLALDAGWGLFVLRLHLPTIKTWVLLDGVTLLLLLVVVVVAWIIECKNRPTDSNQQDQRLRKFGWWVSAICLIMILARTIFDYANSWDFYFPSS